MQFTVTAACNSACRAGQRRVVMAEVSPAWTIDAVEYRNGSGPADWELEKSESKKTQLRINLDVPVSPTNPAN